MRFKLPVIISFMICIFLGASYGIHTYVAQKIIHQIPSQINHVFPPFIRLNYTDLKAENCILSLCFSAQNVTVSLPGNQADKPIIFTFGTVRIERHITGFYRITAHTTKEESSTTKSSIPIQIDFEGTGTKNQGTVQELLFQQNQFQARLSGTVNISDQSIHLKGRTVGLAQFTDQFVPPDLQFIVHFLLQDKPQEITITTDDEWIRVMDIPLILKKDFFNLNQFSIK